MADGVCELCRRDDRRLAAQGASRARSPVEALFSGGSPMGSMLDGLLGMGASGGPFGRLRRAEDGGPTRGVSGRAGRARARTAPS